ncbi:hypothetical protein AXG93_855s1040 [Marchantia polymorpha subsp. ruderalis]|uniref:Reverse transcriptase Ty1/copia-type domain-containing protein n=1 Tax=Marchantia polymorpha subsp. ruderalis TaxID=1480154 RepID=A0A176VYE9_MARPO|nr:hypothetical protein AXG93_855s1040 [Marchantia polymorpha subsp. ruderalis]
MLEELKSLKENETWTVVDKPASKKIVGSRWIFKLKEGIPGVEKPRYKARLVAKGFSQQEGIDYNKIYSPVVKHRSIRIILSMVAIFDLELEQMDVKTAFLYGDLDETIYMQQPEGFEMKDLGPSKVILGMEIERDRTQRRLGLFQKRYLTKVLERFDMSEAKPVNTPIAHHFKLSVSQCPETDEDKRHIAEPRVYRVFTVIPHFDLIAC